MSITLNPGTGGPVVASDVHGGEHLPVNKLAGNKAGLFPGYGGPEDTTPAPVLVDDAGNLMVRSAVLTDEGTFRCNFANTSLWVGIGSVTVSGDTVSGTGFLTADCHYHDYFKVSGDADTAAVQIVSIDSDTQLTLKAAYTGATSGTGQRSIVLPVTGSGGAISVASGQLTLTSGTTASSLTGVARFTDYGPLVYRARFNVSQRIANQGLRAGLRESAATPRWFAWFLIDGTTATTVKCQTARNPSGAPAAAETQETTITLPNGGTTATARDWRVELLTESVRFYVDRVMVAEHVITIPHQHDEMTSVLEFVNGTTPASSTTCVADYLTGKNHNKLEIGVMSDAEQIIAAQPPALAFPFSQAGVIAINTDLLVIDCAQLRGLSIQCTSMGTTGVVTAAFSNDNVTWVNQSLMTGAGAAAATFNAAGLWTTPVLARYFRLRLTTATTAGTTTLAVNGFQYLVGQPVAQPVSGTVTANIGTGSLAAGTNAIGDVGLQVRANATGAATTSHLVSAASTNAANIKNAAGRVLGWSAVNTTASWQYVKLHNSASAPTAGAGVFLTIAVPPNGVNNMAPTLPGIGFSAGIGRTIVTGSADADATATTAGAVVFDLFYA